MLARYEARARHRPPAVPAVSAAEAALAEQSFLRSVHNSLAATRQLWDPCRQTNVPVPLLPTHRINRLVGVRRTAADQLRRWRWLDDCPLGAEVLFDLRRYAWWGRLRGRVFVDVRSLARLERFARKGYDDQPATRAELETLLNRVWRRARMSSTWHLTVLFSPTGWTAESCGFVTGRSPRAFRDPLVSVMLFEAERACFSWDETDARLKRYDPAFPMEAPRAMETSKQ